MALRIRARIAALTPHLRRWLVDGWTPLVAVAAFVAVLVGAAAGMPIGDRVYAYQWADARFCNDCHAHDYANEAWAESIHAGLTTCHDCHRVPIRHYPRNLWVQITDPPKSAEDIPHPQIPVVICGSCHLAECDPHELTGPMPLEMCDHVVKIDNSRLHRVHLESEDRQPGPGLGGALDTEHEEGTITCLDCHGAGERQVHKFSDDVTACSKCHERHVEELGIVGLPCRQCHGSAFLADSDANLPPIAVPANTHSSH
jgi:hypothetical protein